MDNQHSKIIGYPDLDQTSLDQINRVKELEKEVAALHIELRKDPAVDQRCMSIAKTEMQSAFSWFVRAIAQPVDPYVEPGEVAHAPPR